MQALSHINDIPVYNGGMKTGRPAQTKRTPFGERVYQAREVAGLSQCQVAEALGIAQQTYAAWERRTVAIKPADLIRLAEILDVSVNDLLGISREKPKKSGPAGKTRQVFEAVGNLPRHQQRRIVGVVEDLLAARS
jgi:transcriptional regulator with XRE-family HTH domain